MNRRIFAIIISTSIIILSILGCGNNDAISPPYGETEGFYAEASQESMVLAEMISSPVREARGLSYSDLATSNRLTVKNASLDIVVDNLLETISAISVLTRARRGFVVSSQIGGEGINQFGWISVRVPADELESTITQIRSLAVRVTGESTSTQDVTEEHIDLKSRLQVLEETLDQYLRLLDRAKNVEDILKVQKEATNIQSQIEQIKGRINYLETTSATSLLTISLQPSTNPDPLVKPGWNPLETVKAALRGLSGFGQGIADALISIAVFSPVWLTVIGAFWLSIRWIRRRKKS